MVRKGTILLFGSVVLLVASYIEPDRLLAQDLNGLKAAAVRIHNNRNDEVGTGFIVKIDGTQVYIITASHVVRGDQHPQIYFFSQPREPIQAELLDREEDETKGLALIRARVDSRLASTIIAVEFSPTSQLTGGEEVKIIGFPDGVAFWTVSTGTIGRIEGRSVVLSGTLRGGYSGAPVIRDGLVLGLMTDVTQSSSYASRAEVIAIYVNGIVTNLIKSIPDSTRNDTTEGDTLLSQNFKFTLLGCYHLTDSVGCDISVLNLGAARGLGISAIAGSVSYLVDFNDHRFPAFSVTTGGQHNYQHAICQITSRGSCLFQLKFGRGLPQPTLLKGLRVDWTAGDDNNYGAMPPLNFLNPKLGQKPVLDLAGRVVEQDEQKNLDLGGRPTLQTSADPASSPSTNFNGILLPTGSAVTRQKIDVALLQCGVADRHEITCYLRLTNSGVSKRIHISSGRDTYIVDSYLEKKFYSTEMKHDDEDDAGTGNYGHTSFNLGTGQSHGISLTFSVGDYLLPIGDYIKDFKLTWALAAPNTGSNYKWQSPIKFTDIKLMKNK
jgi:hypothetical protein